MSAMQLALKLFFGLLAVVVLVGVHQGTGAFLSWKGPEFTSGFAFGSIGTAVFLFLLHWIDRRRSRAAGPLGDEQGARNRVDL